MAMQIDATQKQATTLRADSERGASEAIREDKLEASNSIVNRASMVNGQHFKWEGKQA
jgi:hypothetical protein